MKRYAIDKYTPYWESENGEFVKHKDVKELIELDKKLKALYSDTTIEFTFRDRLVGIISGHIGEGG